jgi:hypothetical protein
MAPTDDDETSAMPLGSLPFSCGAGEPTGPIGLQFSNAITSSARQPSSHCGLWSARIVDGAGGWSSN